MYLLLVHHHFDAANQCVFINTLFCSEVPVNSVCVEGSNAEDRVCLPSEAKAVDKYAFLLPKQRAAAAAALQNIWTFHLLL